MKLISVNAIPQPLLRCDECGGERTKLVCVGRNATVFTCICCDCVQHAVKVFRRELGIME